MNINYPIVSLCTANTINIRMEHTAALTSTTLTVPRAFSSTKGAKAAQRGRLDDTNAVCKVCGKAGHAAGFVGATYLDCPLFACYLCKQLGHTTATCPHRILPVFYGRNNGIRDLTMRGSTLDHLRLPPHATQKCSAPLRMIHARQVGVGPFIPTSAVVNAAGALYSNSYRDQWVHKNALLKHADVGRLGSWRVTAVLQVSDN